jgi:hypothetical protein
MPNNQISYFVQRRIDDGNEGLLKEIESCKVLLQIAENQRSLIIKTRESLGLDDTISKELNRHLNERIRYRKRILNIAENVFKYPNAKNVKKAEKKLINK